MGIGMVLLAAAVVGTVMASVGGAVLGGATAWFTKGVQHGRRTAILVAAAFPFACLAWGGLVFAFQAIVNETVLHRDAGLGDAWECPLPNGYAVLMIDVTDHGFVYNPKTQTEGAVGEQEDAPYGVRLLQVEANTFSVASTPSQRKKLAGRPGGLTPTSCSKLPEDEQRFQTTNLFAPRQSIWEFS